MEEGPSQGSREDESGKSRSCIDGFRLRGMIVVVMYMMIVIVR
jgi:hypothetical protein